MFTPSFGAARALRSLLAGLVLLALIVLGCGPVDPTLIDTADAPRAVDEMDALAVDPSDDAPSAAGDRPSPDALAPPSDTLPSDPPDVPISDHAPVIFFDGNDAAPPQDVGDDVAPWLPMSADVAEEAPDDVPPLLPMSADVPGDLRDDRFAPTLSMDVALDASDAALPDVALDGDVTSPTYDARVDRPLPDVAALPDTPPIPVDAPPQCASSCDCPLGQRCLDGRCLVPFDSAPPAPLAVVHNRCVDTCQCLRFAVRGATCEQGVCRCPGGGVWCDTRCVDSANDPANCGYCGRTCSSGQTCVAGACTTPCADGQTPCGGRCVDTYADAANCGACGRACGAGERCVAGACRPPCAAHCDCRLGQQCEGGGCVTPLDFSPPTPPEIFRNQCVDTCQCQRFAVSGAVCTEQMCRCPGGGVWCDSRCVNTASDPANCGQCGFACAPSTLCRNGNCQ